MDFHQTWYVHSYCEDLVWDCLWANFVIFFSAGDTIMAGYYTLTFFIYVLITVTMYIVTYFKPFITIGVFLTGLLASLD